MDFLVLSANKQIYIVAEPFWEYSGTGECAIAVLWF